METGAVVVVVLVALVAAAVVALVLGGRLIGSARLPGAELRVKAGRDPEPRPRTASIRDSTAGRDATAIGSDQASVERTVAGRDVIARTPEGPDPKA